MKRILIISILLFSVTMLQAQTSRNGVKEFTNFVDSLHQQVQKFHLSKTKVVAIMIIDPTGDAEDPSNLVYDTMEIDNKNLNYFRYDKSKPNSSGYKHQLHAIELFGQKLNAIKLPISEADKKQIDNATLLFIEMISEFINRDH